MKTPLPTRLEGRKDTLPLILVTCPCGVPGYVVEGITVKATCGYCRTTFVVG